jgi:hypothetical protein
MLTCVVEIEKRTDDTWQRKRNGWKRVERKNVERINVEE